MTHSQDINKAILIGYLKEDALPYWLNNEEAGVYFPLITEEDYNKGSKILRHSEIHHIVIPLTLIKTGLLPFKTGTAIIIHGAIKTICSVNQQVKRYRAEIWATRFDLM